MRRVIRHKSNSLTTAFLAQGSSQAQPNQGMTVALLFVVVVAGMIPGPTASAQQAPPAASAVKSGKDRAATLPAGLPEPSYQADFTPLIATGAIDTAWDKGYLAGFGGGETREPVTLYNKSGDLLFDTFVTISGAARTYQTVAAPGGSEAVVVAVEAVSADGAIADLLLEVGKEGIRRAIRTSPFRPLKICVTDEGSVWAYGWERDATGSDRHGHHAMLREFSFEKGQLRTTLDRATVSPAPGVPVQGRSRSDVQLKCEAGMVALFNVPNNELVEYDLPHGKLNRWSMKPLMEGVYVTGFALTDSGETYVSTLDRSGATPSTGIFRLRTGFSGAEWLPVATAPPKPGWFRLLGSDGESLVYALGVRSPTLYWSKAPQ